MRRMLRPLSGVLSALVLGGCGLALDGAAAPPRAPAPAEVPGTGGAAAAGAATTSTTFEAIPRPTIPWPGSTTPETAPTTTTVPLAPWCDDYLAFADHGRALVAATSPDRLGDELAAMSGRLGALASSAGGEMAEAAGELAPLLDGLRTRVAGAATVADGFVALQELIAADADAIDRVVWLGTGACQPDQSTAALDLVPS